MSGPTPRPSASPAMRKLALAAGIVIIFAMLLASDETTFKPLRRILDKADSDWRANFKFFRHFGSLYATLVASALIFTITPGRRRTIIALLLSVALAGGALSLLKNTISRDRPTATDGRTVFKGLFAGFKGKGGESLPSGHAGVAFANAGALSVLFPPATGVFVFIAAMSALSRVWEGAHFPSDIFLGAVIGWYLARFLMLRFLVMLKHKENESGGETQAS